MLLVAAVEAELGGVPGRALGVGPVVAGIGMARLLAEYPQALPEAVLLIGTAGRLPGGPPVGSLIWASLLGLSDPLTASGTGYVPMAPPPIRPPPPPDSGEILAGVPVLTSPGVTTDLAVAARLAADGWQVEHMECWAAARACQEAGVPIHVLLGIANEVGPEAHTQWRQNRDGLQRRTQEIARSLIQGRGIRG